MTKFSDLTPYILNQIIIKSVEDVIAMEDESARRKILTKLSLVSKRFTVPSQDALWSHINPELHLDNRFMDAVMHRINNPAMINTLGFELHDYEGGIPLAFEYRAWLNSLQGVGRVGRLEIRGSEAGNPTLPVFFSYKSVSEISSLIIYGINLSLMESTLPSTLTSVDWTVSNTLNFEPFFKLLGRSNLRLRSIRLNLSLLDYEEVDEKARQSVVTYFKAGGGKTIKRADFLYLPVEMINILLPYLPSLTTLIAPLTTIREAFRILKLLPKSIKLEALTLGFLPIKDCIRPSSFLPLLLLPQLSRLKLLRTNTDPASYGSYFQTKTDTGGEGIDNLSIQIDLKKTVRFFKSRNLNVDGEGGIELKFWKEIPEFDFTEGSKQQYYKEREERSNWKKASKNMFKGMFK